MPRIAVVIAGISLVLVGGILAWTIFSNEQPAKPVGPDKRPPTKTDVEKSAGASPVKTMPTGAVVEKGLPDKSIDEDTVENSGEEKHDDKEESEPKHDTRVVVKITSITEAEGNLRVAIYCDATGWTKDMNSHLSENQLELKVVEAKVDSVECVFEHLPPGTYAISLFHDVDKSEKMNMVKKLFVEMPNEPFGFSNDFDPFRKMRPPRMRDCSFEVVKGTPKEISIELQ